MPRPGAGWIVFPLLVGHLRAAISIASHNGLGAACCRPNRVPDCFLGAAAGNGRQADRVPPRVRIQVDVAHPPALPGLSAAGVPLDQVGARAPGPGGRRRWRRAFRRGRAAWRALGAHGRVRTASRSTRPRPRGRRAAVMRRYPPGSVRGTGLSPDEKGQSASSGSSRRHPARRLVVARPPGTPAPLAHQYRPGSCAPGGKWPPTPGVTSAPPFAKYAAAFLRQLAPPLLALRTAGRAAPRVPGRLAAETLLTPGRRNDPCGTCPPRPPLLWAGRPLPSSHRRDRPAPSPAISRTTRNPEPIRAPRSRHSPILSRYQNTGSPLSKKHQAPQSWPSPTSRHGACPPPAAGAPPQPFRKPSQPSSGSHSHTPHE